jgi:PAS domain S-box-containing protein
MEGASDIICILDPDGTVTSINRAGQELLGNISGNNILDIVEQEYQEETWSYIMGSQKDAQPAQEIIVINPRAERLVLSIRSTPIYQDGRSIGLMIIARDITTEREMSLKLIEAEKFAAKGIVAAEIAHEINNSLANLETSLYIVNKLKVDNNYKNDLSKTISEEIERMSDIVRGILDVYSSDDSKIQHIDINQEINKVIEFTKRRLKGKGIEIVSILSKTSPYFLCSLGHLKQILLNLIKNAEEALENSDTKRIVISSHENEYYVILCVKDTGGGIPVEFMDKVTQKLFTTKSSGTGLGLSLCKQLVERNNGEMEIDSMEGEGTSVSIIFKKDDHGQHIDS